MRSATAYAVSTASPELSSALITATRGTTGAELKKCIPTTTLGMVRRHHDLRHRERRGVGREDTVRQHDRRELRCRFTSSCSVTASITQVTGRQPFALRAMREFTLDGRATLLKQLVFHLARHSRHSGLNATLGDAGSHSAQTNDADPCNLGHAREPDGWADARPTLTPVSPVGGSSSHTSRYRQRHHADSSGHSGSQPLRCHRALSPAYRSHAWSRRSCR